MLTGFIASMDHGGVLRILPFSQALIKELYVITSGCAMLLHGINHLQSLPWILAIPHALIKELYMITSGCTR